MTDLAERNLWTRLAEAFELLLVHSKRTRILRDSRCSVCLEYHLCQKCFAEGFHKEHQFNFREVTRFTNFAVLVLFCHENILCRAVDFWIRTTTETKSTRISFE